MRVIAVEVPFEFKLENPETGKEFPIPIKGIIDLIEEDDNGTLWVVDHKISSRAFSEQQLNADLQLMIYAAAVEQLDLVEEREKRYRFDVLVKTKKPKFLQYRLYKDDLDRRKLYRMVTEMWKAGSYHQDGSGRYVPGRESDPIEPGETITVPLAGLAPGAKPLEMVKIDPGSFTMGSPSAEQTHFL